jgi:elongation factor Ts
MEAAVDWLRKKGLSAAAKKAGRVAAEGLIGIVTENGVGAMVEVNSETDFVARNDKFQAYVENVAQIAKNHEAGLSSLAEDKYGHGTDRNVGEELTNLISVIGENMTLRRMVRLAIEPGVVVSYLHNAATANTGKLGVLIALESEGDKSRLEALGKQIAMHIAAAHPQSISTEDLDPALLERERSILIDQAKASGKPENVIEKMVEGRLRKFYEESVLLEQTFVIDGESKIKDVLKNVEKEIGAPIKISSFVRYGLGEGVEKKEDDFASEVANLAG